MFRPRVIPVLLLKGKGLVKTEKFSKKNARYIGDPINAVRIFNDLEADELIFLDIMATKENRTISCELVKEIGDEAFMPFAVGGGIREVSQIRELLSSGAEKVVINTAAGRNIRLITDAANQFGEQSIVASIDVKKNIWGVYKVYINAGNESSDLLPHEYAKSLESAGAGEIMINSIDRDGMMGGYDLSLIKAITQAVNIPVIACGGAGSVYDLKESIITGGASAVAAGSLFVYHGPRRAVLVNYPDKNTLLQLFN
ncbi:MAG: AglZ/HisF2 family acetamidino modification protein [Lentimicrobium sp.]